MTSRIHNAIENSKYSIINKLVNLATSFIIRTIFIIYLGKSYLGINGLYSEIFGFLSFAELGFGTALTFSMYKPIAENDNEKIIKILNFYKKIYIIIAFIVLFIGLLILPFLHIIIKDEALLSLNELRLYFILYLINTVATYFVSYKISYVNALQNNYVVSKIETICSIFSSILFIISIVCFKNYLFYLIFQIFVTISTRVLIALYLNSKYAILKKKCSEQLSSDEKKSIYNEVKGLAIHQFSSVAIHQTDNILISSLIDSGVIIVGLVSNYNMIINASTGFILLLFNSLTSGFGNLAASSSASNFKKVFNVANFVNFWIYGFLSIALFVLLPPFIFLWLGKDFLIDELCLFLIIINCYLQGQSTLYNNARIAKGSFNLDKWWALLQAIVNVVVSIICAKEFGLIGIYIGTVVSRMVYVLFRPYSTYKFMFNETCFSYYKTFFTYFISVVFAGFVTYFTIKILFSKVTFFSFILELLIVILLPNLIFYILYRKNEYYTDFINRLKGVVKIK